MNIAILDTTLANQKHKSSQIIRYIDLFAGMGGTRVGFEKSLATHNLKGKCVFTSEIKQHAIKAYQANFGKDKIYGDITSISPSQIPEFDFLLAGFPCQPFSSAGKRQGFLDERGGLFFSIHKILQQKKPSGFLLENVDALVSHDNGNTLKIILNKLSAIGYHVNYQILDSSKFGIPQIRKRVYIIGHKKNLPQFLEHCEARAQAKDFIQYNEPFKENEFSKILRAKFTKIELEGKSIKDKRGGKNNIHSWEIDLKGKVNSRQKKLLSEILKKRRYKKWAELKKIHWMDGMPLTKAEIQSFIDYKELADDLEYLTKCGYLKYEHPKDLIIENGISKRVYKTSSEKGYNIVAGKLSFPIAKILNPDELVPTIVATEVGKIAVSTNEGVRSITVKEGLSFSGFPDWYKLDNISYRKSFDLLGNTVMPPVISYVSDSLIEVHLKNHVRP